MSKKIFGFTLLEMIVVAAVLGILSLLFTQILYMTIRTNTKTESLKNVKQNGDHALDVMTRMIQNAKTVDTDCYDEYESTKYATGSVTVVGWDGGSSRLECVEDGTTARIASVSSGTQYLTGEDVTLGDIATASSEFEFIKGINPVGSEEEFPCANYPLRFICTSTGGRPTGIQIFFLLQQASHSSQFQEALMNFTATVGVRN